MPKSNWIFTKLGEFKFTPGNWCKWDSLSPTERQSYESKYEDKITESSKNGRH